MIEFIKEAGVLMSKNKRLVWFHFAAGLVLSLIAVIPLRSLLNTYLGSSLMRARLESGIDIDFLAEFLLHSEGFVPMIFPLVLTTVILYFAVNLLFSAGTFGLFLQEESYDSAYFWGTGGRYFWRFFRLAMWSLALLAILLGLTFLLNTLGKSIFGDDPERNITYYWMWLRVAARLLIIGFVYMVFDYARIITVYNEEKRTYRTFFAGIYFVLRNFLRTAPLAIFYALCAGLIFVLYFTISPLVAYKTGFFAFLILFLLQQAAMFARMLIKVSLFAGETKLFRFCNERSLQKQYANDLELRPVTPPSL